MIQIYTLRMSLRIKDLRKERGLSQQELADMAKISRSQLSEIETEAKPANTLRLNAIAAALDVPVDQLFNETARDQYSAEIVQIMADLSAEDRAKLVRVAKAMAEPQ